MTQDIQRQAQRSAGHLVSTFLIAAGAGVLVLLAVAALLLWGFNGKTLILDMVAFFCV